MAKYPTNLINYIEECESEGAEVFICNSEFDFIAIIKFDSDKYIDIISWSGETEDYEHLNISGKAFDRLYKVMTECKEDAE